LSTKALKILAFRILISLRPNKLVLIGGIERGSADTERSNYSSQIPPKQHNHGAFAEGVERNDQSRKNVSRTMPSNNATIAWRMRASWVALIRPNVFV